MSKTEGPAWLQRFKLNALEHPDEITLFEQERVEQERERIISLYEHGGPQGVILSDLAMSLCERLLDTMEPLGLGPAHSGRIEDIELRPWIWVSRSNPQQLLLALHEQLPPFLWFAAGQDLFSIKDALEADIAQETPPALELERHARAFIGTEDMIGLADLEAFSAHLSANPFVEPLLWGSAHAQDPWPEQITDEELFALADPTSDKMAQDPLAIQSLSARTSLSRSVITIEDHQGVFVVQVRYEPAQHQDQILALNAQFGAHYPADMPLDVVAALLGFYFEDAKVLLSFIAESFDPDEIALYAHILSCVQHGELSLVEALRPLLTHRDEQVRLIAAEIAIRQRFTPLILGRLFNEPDEQLREHLLERLDSADYVYDDASDEEA